MTLSNQMENIDKEVEIFFFFNVCFWEKETDREWVRGGEREADTESEAGSRLQAVSTEPDRGLEPTSCEIMTWAEVRHLTNWATQALLYTMENYSTIKENEILTFATLWVELESTILSEISHLEKDKFMILLIRGI